MMQSANFWELDHRSFCRHLNGSCHGRVFLQREMGARSMIVGEIRGQETSQMPLTENDHVVQTLAAKRSDQSLRIRVLSRT
jgi:hypothetical protein